MEKVKITQEQADAIVLARMEMPDYIIKEKHRSDEMWTGAYGPLNRLSTFDINRIFEGNFEIN